jgi:hypothetical protein
LSLRRLGHSRILVTKADREALDGSNRFLIFAALAREWESLASRMPPQLPDVNNPGGATRF